MSRNAVLFFIALVGLNVIAWGGFERDKIKAEEIGPTVLGIPNNLEEEVKMVYKGNEYRVDWVKVNDISGVKLESNLESMRNASEIYEAEECGLLVNGGFYTKENTHIGLLVSEGEEISKSVRSSLFDGFLSVNYMEIPRIERVLSKDLKKVALQSGPIIFENGSKIKLTIRNDKLARRVVAAISGSNELMFLVFYNPESYYSGPFLADLPEVLEKLNEEQNLNIADAINLDGGTASAFYSGDFSLSELSPVGSYFCLK